MNSTQYVLRNKLRFPYKTGMISVEDLWDLGVNALDEVACDINTRLKDAEDGSFIPGKDKNDTLAVRRDKHRLAAVVEVIEYKVSQKDANEKRALKAAKKQELLHILNDKQHEETRKLSVEELTKMIEEVS